MATRGGLVVRADAGAAIGTGHVMRGLAVAGAWTAAGGDRACFVAASPLPDDLSSRLRADGFGVRCLGETVGSAADAAATALAARAVGAAAVLLDGYAFDGVFEDTLRGAGLAVAAIDDFGHTRHRADLVVNQNLHAAEDQYLDRAPWTRLLLGPRHALLRPEFARWRDRGAIRGEAAGRVLMTMGGSDPARVTGRAIEALAPAGLAVRVILGAANPAAAQVEAAARAAGMEVFRDVRDISLHMAWADVAVATPSVTLLELLFMGVPSVLVTVADNQRPGAKAAGDLGLARVLGWHEEVGPTEIRAAVEGMLGDPAGARRMVAAGRALVDGRGAERVCAAIGERG